MAELTAHEKFLRGEPLTPELEAFRDGREPAPAADAAPRPRHAFDDPDRPLTRSERLDLKEWREMPGWELFRRLIERATSVHQKRAIAYSQDNPLTKRDEIAAEWAYLNLFRRAANELETLVDGEVAELEKTQ
jgi:hypothetical protein